LHICKETSYWGGSPKKKKRGRGRIHWGKLGKECESPAGEERKWHCFLPESTRGRKGQREAVECPRKKDVRKRTRISVVAGGEKGGGGGVLP